jgi:hypothetical protein
MWPRRKPEPKPVAMPAWDASFCRALLYEPGADHEHLCLAIRKHPGLDHTCGVSAHRCQRGEGERCCKTWSEPKTVPGCGQ